MWQILNKVPWLKFAELHHRQWRLERVRNLLLDFHSRKERLPLGLRGVAFWKLDRMWHAWPNNERLNDETFPMKDRRNLSTNISFTVFAETIGLLGRFGRQSSVSSSSSTSRLSRPMRNEWIKLRHWPLAFLLLDLARGIALWDNNSSSLEFSTGVATGAGALISIGCCLLYSYRISFLKNLQEERPIDES